MRWAKAGMAHGLEYGDNFLSVLIANCADEMAGFLRAIGARNIEVEIRPGRKTRYHIRKALTMPLRSIWAILLVTCYSLYSRNQDIWQYDRKGSIRSSPRSWR